MSEQILIQFRADKTLKDEVSAIYEAIGMDLPTAFRMFMVRSKMEKGLPFPAVMSENSIKHDVAVAAFDLLRKQSADVREMTLDEINAEIAEVRAERKEL
ncbi:MAG: RelB/DinJ family addiction module antitoxin [Clostridia bacterium]|nr:RelB/DinJ family addiction module antitoxin [Clostridia bacterium]